MLAGRETVIDDVENVMIRPGAGAFRCAKCGSTLLGVSLQEDKQQIVVILFCKLCQNHTAFGRQDGTRPE